MENKEGGLSMSDIDAFRAEYEALVEEMLVKRDELAELTGYGGKEASKDTLSRGIKEITEDTANSLASYVNAIRADVSVNKEQMLQIVKIAQLNEASMGQMLEQLILIQTNTLDTANNTQRSVDIAKKTFELLQSVTIKGGAIGWNLQ